VDGDLAGAGIIRRRLCHQANPNMAKAINKGDVFYADMGPYAFANQVRYGYFGDLDLCAIEAVEITAEGHIIPSTCPAEAPTFIKAARQVIIEINTNLPLEMAGLHDIVLPENPPGRKSLPIETPADRVGTPYIPVDPKKVAGIILSGEQGQMPARDEINEESREIARHLIRFFEKEVSAGRMPENLLPLQTGLGALGGAILSELGQSRFTNLQTFSALLSDSILDLIDAGKIKTASGTGLYFSAKGMEKFYREIAHYKQYIILRPVDISTYPELIQKLGVIAFNGAVEVDIYGHVNSTHLGGGRVMTGVAGSIEYSRNGSLSIFMTPSTGKKGDISRIVPMVPHVDHTEHDVHIVVTEQGLADLRGLDPRERALEMINQCAHPDYRPLLMEYFERAKSQAGGHEPQLLDEAFSFHRRLREKGSMKLAM
jgi:succinyl-CoA:acetate CoA-transferase